MVQNRAYFCGPASATLAQGAGTRSIGGARKQYRPPAIPYPTIRYPPSTIRLDRGGWLTVESTVEQIMTTYAIVQTGGKQYQVRSGDTIRVESLPQEPGETVELGDVLMVSKDGEVKVGNPTVSGARVTAEIAEHGRGKKIVVFKYKAKTRYRRKQGHRQSYTALTVKDITA